MDGESPTTYLELTTGIGASSGNTSPSETKNPQFPGPKMLVVLSADYLASAITLAHEAKMDSSAFALNSARKILDILPPLYYEPRND